MALKHVEKNQSDKQSALPLYIPVNKPTKLTGYYRAVENEVYFYFLGTAIKICLQPYINYIYLK